jgi:hypothetical protein
MASEAGGGRGAVVIPVAVERGAWRASVAALAAREQGDGGERAVAAAASAGGAGALGLARRAFGEAGALALATALEYAPAAQGADPELARVVRQELELRGSAQVLESAMGGSSEVLAFARLASVEWRLDYNVRTSEAGSTQRPVFVVRLRARQGCGGDVEFVATQQQMEDLVATLADARCEAQRAQEGLFGA